jgi:hypothetical protein
MPIDLPENDDEFDRSITNSLGDEAPKMGLSFALAEMHETFEAMLEVGFTEVQSLRFLAFCAIYEGDL